VLFIILNGSAHVKGLSIILNNGSATHLEGRAIVYANRKLVFHLPVKRQYASSRLFCICPRRSVGKLDKWEETRERSLVEVESLEFRRGEGEL
jgi:hypothetical protein